MLKRDVTSFTILPSWLTANLPRDGPAVEIQEPEMISKSHLRGNISRPIYLKSHACNLLTRVHGYHSRFLDAFPYQQKRKLMWSDFLMLPLTTGKRNDVSLVKIHMFGMIPTLLSGTRNMWQALTSAPFRVPAQTRSRRTTSNYYCWMLKIVRWMLTVPVIVNPLPTNTSH